MEQILYLEIKQLLVVVMVDKVITPDQETQVMLVGLVVVVDKVTIVQVLVPVALELQDKVLQVQRPQVHLMFREEEAALVVLRQLVEEVVREHQIQ
jgi:hypothetical protein